VYYYILHSTEKFQDVSWSSVGGKSGMHDKTHHNVSERRGERIGEEYLSEFMSALSLLPE
jgi:hypothetical protein